MSKEKYSASMARRDISLLVIFWSTIQSAHETHNVGPCTYLGDFSFAERGTARVLSIHSNFDQSLYWGWRLQFQSTHVTKLAQGKLIKELFAIEKMSRSCGENVSGNLPDGRMIHKVQIRGELDERKALLKVDDSNKGMLLKYFCQL
jgi:hypothetical protein